MKHILGMIGAAIIGRLMAKHYKWWDTEFLLGLLAVILIAL